MTKVALMRDSDSREPSSYRAVAGRVQAMGKTAGEAVDALAEQLSEEQTETLIIVRALRADRYFAAEPRRRLDDLMARWRAARDVGGAFSPEEQAELERLVEAEVRAATDRAEAVRDDLSR